MSYRPPDSTGSTNSSLHHPLSHSPSGSWADTIEEQVIEEEAPLAWGSSDDSEDDNMVDEVDDSLMDAAPHAVEAVALEELGLMPYQQQKDRPDIWASPAFNRPLLGTENDREVGKRMGHYFKNLTQYLDDTEWMYPTPQTFRPSQPDRNSASSTTAASDARKSGREAPLDLPVFQHPAHSLGQMQEASDLITRMRNMRVIPGRPPSHEADAPQSSAPRPDGAADSTGGQTEREQQQQREAFASFADTLGQAEAELEMSFANDSFPGRNAHLVRGVSMLGV